MLRLDVASCECLDLGRRQCRGTTEEGIVKAKRVHAVSPCAGRC
ncbi:hypothetical protein NK6_8753 [Bradyrhizobium diazoefficiens]|uniref:Uncharacterized protein n=1 Tax=Bradyrhizobium diazoefficiens TaxID=1355477 RepID=A0A0E3VX21_9BRAD|nr:hypothetical protein NK6_8753 [Bradyrhizobium diazoefficiens]